jgi:large subunit ribosomal protein L1
MAKVSKKRKAVAGKVDANKVYSLPEAMALVKVVNTAKFDASVDVPVKPKKYLYFVLPTR